MEADFNFYLNQAINGSSPLFGAAKLFGYLFIKGGWVIVSIAFLDLIAHFWYIKITDSYAAKRKWVLLAIDVPKDNEQTPRAVENIFAHLAGAHGSETLVEKYWYGMTQDWFSLELVSIEGSVQFIIRTVERYRDLVEAAIYSQYPNAEIVEIEDYTTDYPTVFPNDRYDLYGTEFVYVENQALPIRTYPEFEHMLTRELKDPMHAILETMNKLGSGEQLWLQILIEPIDTEWKKEVIKRIEKITGSGKHAPGIISNIVAEVGKFGSSASDQFSGGSGIIEAKPGDNKTGPMITLLSPFVREQAEAMSRKIKHIGFKTKIRSVYIATKDRFNAQHGREALIGAFKQFNTEDLNSLKPDTAHVGVHAHYFFIEWRKNLKKTKLMARYKKRSVSYGRVPKVMNTEELATIWHFPTKTEFTPIRYMVQQTEFKHTPPPSSLPYRSELKTRVGNASNHSEKKEPKTPDNLPIK